VAVVVAVAVASPGLRDWRLSASIDRLTAEHAAGERTWDEVASELRRLRPASFVAAQDVAVGYVRQGDGRAGIGAMNRAQILAPRHPSPHLWTARVLRHLGAADQALIEYRKVLEIDWRYQGRDVVLEVADRYDDAQSLIRLAGRDGVLSARIAWILFQEGDARAGEVADTAEGPHGLVQLVKARARILSGAPREGAAIARRALRRSDATPWLRARLTEHIELAEAQLALATER
jgi:hypothetical protein